MFAQIIVKSFTKNIRRKILAVAIIMVGIGLVAALLNIWADIENRVAKELRVYGSNIVVKPKTRSGAMSDIGFDPLKQSSFLNVADLTSLKTIFWRNNIIVFAPFVETRASVESEGSNVQTITVTGTWFEKDLSIPTGEKFKTGVKKIKPWWKVAGRWPKDEFTDNEIEVLAGKDLAGKLKVAQGDKITVSIGNSKFKAKISGILEADQSEESRVYVPISVVQRAKEIDGQAGWAEISALTTPDNDLAKKYERNAKALSSKEFETWYCTAYIKSIAFQIEEVIRGAEAIPVRQIADSEGAILNKVKYLMMVFIIMAFLISVVGIWGLMSGYVQERSAEVGLSKAIGASSSSIIAIFLTEAILIGLLGGFLGILLGHLASIFIGSQVFGRAIGANGASLLISLLLAVSVSFFGNLSTVLAIIRLNTKDVIHAN